MTCLGQICVEQNVDPQFRVAGKEAKWRCVKRAGKGIFLAKVGTVDLKRRALNIMALFASRNCVSETAHRDPVMMANTVWENWHCCILSKCICLYARYRIPKVSIRIKEVCWHILHDMYMYLCNVILICYIPPFSYIVFLA